MSSETHVSQGPEMFPTKPLGDGYKLQGVLEPGGAAAGEWQWGGYSALVVDDGIAPTATVSLCESQIQSCTDEL